MVEQPIVEVRDLRKTFAVKHAGGVSLLLALNGVSFDIMRGETLGLVGESGSGKTSAGRVLVGLIPATSGSVTLFGHSITGPDAKAQLAAVRSRLQLVFQDPYASLNPRMRIGNAIAEPLDIQGSCSRRDRNDRVAELLELVGLPKLSTERYPHEFSGGQRAGVGAGRVDAGPDRQSAARPAGSARAQLSLHRPRPGRGSRGLHPHRGDVCRGDRRERSEKPALFRSSASVFEGVA
jgi:ABC-type glutathione transport system ATPase component